MHDPKLILDYVYDHEAAQPDEVLLVQPVGGGRVVLAESLRPQLSNPVVRARVDAELGKLMWARGTRKRYQWSGPEGTQVVANGADILTSRPHSLDRRATAFGSQTQRPLVADLRRLSLPPVP